MSTEDTAKLLLAAALEGNAKEVRRLIPLSDPKAHNSAPLRMSAQNGHTECLKLLIPVSDPKARDSEALQWAA